MTSIPNPIDTRLYRKTLQAEARNNCKLPLDKRLILFVSQRVTDPRKGIAQLVDAINKLVAGHPETKGNTGIIILGGHAEEVAERFPLTAYPHVQHLIIDGASKDDTLNIAKEYQQRCVSDKSNHQVIIQSEPDDGLYDAMNKAIALATGQYLVFLNAGDTFPAADTLRIAASNINEEETRPVVLYGDTDIVDQDGHFLRHRRLSPPKQLTWHSFRKGMLVCHQSFYALTEIARTVNHDTHYRDVL